VCNRVIGITFPIADSPERGYTIICSVPAKGDRTHHVAGVLFVGSSAATQLRNR